MSVPEKHAAIWNRMQAGETFDYEGMLAQLYQKWIRPGDTVIDIGAHAGLHFDRLIELVGSEGTVVGFEPLPHLYAELVTRHPGAILHNVALSSTTGTSDFVFARNAPGMSGFLWRTYAAPDAPDIVTLQVEVRRLDDMIAGLDGISFIKIDVEGAEVSVLKGGNDTIAKHRPVISAEYGKPSYSAYGLTKFDLYDLAIERDYRIFDIFLNDLSERSEWDAGCDGIVWDFLLVPAEKLARFKSALGIEA